MFPFRPGHRSSFIVHLPRDIRFNVQGSIFDVLAEKIGSRLLALDSRVSAFQCCLLWPHESILNTTGFSRLRRAMPQSTQSTQSRGSDRPQILAIDRIAAPSAAASLQGYNAPPLLLLGPLKARIFQKASLLNLPRCDPSDRAAMRWHQGIQSNGPALQAMHDLADCISAPFQVPAAVGKISQSKAPG